MKVEVRPVPVKRWHKKDGKDSFSRPKTIEALYDKTVGGHATGLTPEEEREYGKKLGLDLNNRFDSENPNPVWTSKAMSIKLLNQTMFFDTSNPKEYVLVKILKASKFVANSMKEYDNNMWPEATHVIFDEKEEVEEKASKIQLKEKLYAKLAVMPEDEKRSIIMILTKKSLRNQSNSFVTVEMDELLSERTDELLRLVDTPKADRFARSTILEAIERRFLTKSGSNILWMGDIVATDTDDAVKWILNPENQIIKAKLLEQLQK